MKFTCKSGVQLFYEEKGNPNSPHVVGMMNGVMASTSSWSNMIPVLERLGMRVILHDFQGQMFSDKPERVYSFEEHCLQAKELYESLGVKQLHLIGTSYGGEVAMNFALYYPNMTKTITIIDSVSEVDEVCHAFVDSWKTLCDIADGEQFFKGMSPSIYGAKYLANNKELMATRSKAFQMMSKSYFVGQKWLYETFNTDLHMTNELKNIQCPALIICGENDILKPVKFSRLIAQEIPNSEFVIIPDSGHVTIFEQPDTLNSVVIGFLYKHL